MEPLQTPPPVPGLGVAGGPAQGVSPFIAGPGLQAQAAATPLTPLAGPAKPHPSPLRRRGYFTDVHGGGAVARMPSLFGRADERGSKLMSAGTSLPTEASPDACPSPTTACKDKLHRSFQIAKIQINHDLESFLQDVRRAAAAGVDDGDSLARVVAAAERCLEEDVAAFRHSIQAVVDGVEELRRSCAAREVRGWATRLLFILTRCSRLVATEEASPLGGGGAGSGGRHAGASAYLTVQPRSKGPGRARRFSGFPMLQHQLSLDPAAPAALPVAAPPSPRGGASPLLRSATAPSRGFRDLLAGVHHLRLHDGGGGATTPAPPATIHLKLPGTLLSPMPESPSTVRSPAAASDASTPSHAGRPVGLSPLGRSVVTALEAELEQAACQEAAAAAGPTPNAQQPWRAAAAGTSGGDATPTAADSPSKRQGLFKMLKMRFHGLRSASKERAAAAPLAAAPQPLEASEGVGSSGCSPAATNGASPLAAAAAAAAATAEQQGRGEGALAATLPSPSSLVLARAARRAQSADAAAMGLRAAHRLHPGVLKALTLEAEGGSPAASPRGVSPRRHVCAVCEQAVAAGALERHARVCDVLEALCREGGDVDAALTRLGNRVEEALGAPALAADDFEALEDLVAACRQVASLQPDGSRQPQLRCEGIAALLQRLLDAGEAASPAAAAGLDAAPSPRGGGGLSPEAGAFARHVLRLVRRKLGELRTAVPGRMSDAPGSGASTPRAAGALCIDDFEILKPISRGAFGRVYLARKRATGELYAVKVMRKVDLIRKNLVQSAKNERNILAMANNPFVVRFYASFTSRDNLYIVMEYLPGGDLYSLLRALGALDEAAARQYVAEAVLALEYCHTQGIIHRDLKPDNLLVSAGGHIKLTDFGLSCLGLIDSTDPALPAAMDVDAGPVGPDGLPASPKARRRSSAAPGPEAAAAASPASKADAGLREAALMASPRLAAGLGTAAAGEEARRAVGTPDYLAPELLLGTGHGLECDWWSLGCILFEFVVGAPPFAADTPQQIFQNILDRNISWPEGEEVSAECRDLVESLLRLEPKQRLGHRGAGEVKLHPWFAGVDWASLARQKVAFVPQPDGDTDTSYFSSKPVSQRSLALDLDSSRGELDLAAVTAAVGAACPPASPAASLASSRSASRAGSRRPSVRRRSLRQALAEPSGASLSELRGMRAATASASSAASSHASLSGTEAMALDGPEGSLTDLHRQRSSASEAWQRPRRRHGPGHLSRGASMLRGSSELPLGAASSTSGVLAADGEDLAAAPSSSSLGLAAACAAAAEAAPGPGCGRYAADARSESGSSCGSPTGSHACSSGGEAGSELGSEGSEGFSSGTLELVQEQNRMEALRDHYEEEFSEFDRPPDLAALRSLTPSPERPPPPR